MCVAMCTCMRGEVILNIALPIPPHTFQAEFGFATWQSFSDRLVGFVAHKHYWDPIRLQWSYTSDWSNDYSMVLTGALFYHRQVFSNHCCQQYKNKLLLQRLVLYRIDVIPHRSTLSPTHPPTHPFTTSFTYQHHWPFAHPHTFRYYGYMLTTSLPPQVQSLLGQNPNCLDIVFNFMVAHITHQPPVKVTQKRALSRSQVDSTFMQQKQNQNQIACFNMATNAYGYVPLVYSSVRMDPILFKDNVSMFRKEYRKLEVLYTQPGQPNMLLFQCGPCQPAYRSVSVEHQGEIGEVHKVSWMPCLHITSRQQEPWTLCIIMYVLFCCGVLCGCKRANRYFNYFQTATTRHQ